MSSTDAAKSAANVPQRSLSFRAVLGICCLVAAVSGASAWWMARRSFTNRSNPVSGSTHLVEEPHDGSSKPLSEAAPIVLEQTSWPSAGIELGTPKSDVLTLVTEVTGKITLNEDRVAHVYPLVAGRVEEVFVQFGQRVKAGDVLASIHSPEIGDGKLKLYRDRLLLQYAALKNEWSQSVVQNSGALSDMLKKDASIEEIEQAFRDRPMGDYRQQLVGAYVNLSKSRIEYKRLQPLEKEGAIPLSRVTTSKAALDADLAIFQALLEQIHQDAKQSALAAEQALREAETRILVDEAALNILGYPRKELADIDPIKEENTLAHYQLRAPFDGTVLTKDIVLLERVDPNRQLMSIADLSTVWVTADIFEHQLPLLRRLAGKDVTFRSSAWPDKQFSARVFYTGETVDESSRTVGMRAVAQNREGFLKPGMFVDVLLTETSDGPVLLVPITAIQEYEGKSFLFVFEGENRFVRQDVRFGRRNEKFIEVVEGLDPDTQIVVNGGFALKTRMLANLLRND